MISSPGGGRPLVMGWTYWLKLSLSDRVRVRKNPDSEYEAFFASHGAPRAGSKEWTRLFVKWERHSRPEWQPLQFGHRYVQGNGTCGGNWYWSARTFDISARLAKAPLQPDGSILTELYGYKLSNRQNGWARNFVVLRYRVCTRPVEGTADCT